jgi:hypothetical protein
MRSGAEHREKMDYLSRLWHTSLRTEKLLEKGENKSSLNVPDISLRLPIEFRVGDARYVANTWAKVRFHNHCLRGSTG